MINIYQPVSGGGGGLTIGTTTITSGTSTRLLFDAAGVVSETDGATWDATNKAFTVGGATVTTSNPVLNLSQTWNDGAVTFTGLKLDVTNTSSASASMLMDLQVGGASKVKIRKDGAIYSDFSGSVGTCAFALTSDYATGLSLPAGGIMELVVSGNRNVQIVGNSIGLNANTNLGYGAALSWGSGGAGDVGISRQAAGVIRVNNASTGGGALELLEQTAPLAGASNTVRLYAEDNGSGKTRLMALFNSGAAQQVAIEP